MFLFFQFYEVPVVIAPTEWEPLCLYFFHLIYVQIRNQLYVCYGLKTSGQFNSIDLSIDSPPEESC